MRITSKGQVTVPAEIRKRAGLLPNTEVEFIVTNGHIIIQKAQGRGQRGKQLLQAMRGKAQTKLSTDDIMALIRGEES